MITPCFQTGPVYGVPRPDRLYQQFRVRHRPEPADREPARTILAQYGLQARGRARGVGGPGRSHNVIVDTDAGPKFIKRYKHTVASAAITHEHAILQRLAEIGFPAPRLVHTPQNTTLVEYYGKHYAVFDVLHGYFQYHQYMLLPSQTRRCVAAAGHALGALHTALHDWTPAGCHPNGFRSRTGDRWRDLPWYLEHLDAARNAANVGEHNAARALRGMLAQHADQVESTLTRLHTTLRAADPPRMIIHGDYGPYNLLYKRGAPVVVIDWELARLDWRLVDLATAFGFWARSRRGFSFTKARWLLDGYRRASAIGADELQLLPAVWQFLTLRRVLVCWQRWGQTGSHTWCDEAHSKLNLAAWIEGHQLQLSHW